MITINKVIADAKKLRIGAFTDDQIADWVWQLEQEITTEIKGLPNPGDVMEANWDEPLQAVGTYERIYLLYVVSQIDFFLQEYVPYNNSMLAFKSAYDEYKAGYHRKNPKPAVYWKGLF